MDNEQLVARIRAGEDVAKHMLQLYNQNKGFLAKMAKRYQGYAELEDLNEYNRAVKEYRKYYGEWPSDFVLCRLLDISQEKLQEIKKNVQIGQMQSLSEVIGGEDAELTIEDTIASDQDLEGDVIQEADAAAMKRELWIAVDRLPGNLPEVIRRRYINGQTLKEIGERIGVSISQARQAENRALRTLRQPVLSRKYHKYYEEYISANSYRHVGVESFMRTGLSEVELEVLGWIQ